MTASIIETDKLSTSFTQGGRQQHVLRNVDLQIEQGSFTAIMGPSGSGKSTLLYALSGLARPTLGSVQVAEVEISALSRDKAARFRRDHCGFVFQQVHLVEGMTVLENLMAVGLLTQRERRPVRERAVELLERVGIGAADQRKAPGMLSGGEAQRVGVARALMNHPDVLFADEPTGQLNSANSEQVLDLLTQVHTSGQTVVMVTHDVRSAERATRVCYLRDGHIDAELHLDPWTPEQTDRTSRLTTFLDDCGW